VDAYSINQLGVPGVVLMENAGRNAAELIAGWLRRSGAAIRGSRTSERGGRGAAVAVVCGKGNNGGDGFVIARHLFRIGFDVWVDLAADPQSLSGDAAINHASAAALGIPMYSLLASADLRVARRRWRRADCVVDALLGTGFTGEVREPLAGVIRGVNALRGDSKGRLARPQKHAGVARLVRRPLIVAVDVPSGLDCDTGTAAGEVVRADRTVTFLASKVGFAQASARPYVGRFSVADIGVPLSAILERLV
jgi:hydroxyethylthiazole kinase-like uncharacterized protein yjeF